MVDASSGNLYRKESGNWVLKGNITGPHGPTGVGVPTGGTTGQVLAKKTGTNYDTEWLDQPDLSTREALGVTAAPNTQTASYTLVLTDKGKTVRMNVASANTLTVPPNDDVAFAIGTYVNWRQAGAGKTTLVAGSGVTLNNRNGLVSLGQNAGGTLHKVGTNEWDVYGELGTS